VVLKFSIGFKTKEGARFEPEEYGNYFEYLNLGPNAEIGPAGRF